MLPAQDLRPASAVCACFVQTLRPRYVTDFANANSALDEGSMSKRTLATDKHAPSIGGASRTVRKQRHASAGVRTQAKVDANWRKRILPRRFQ
jgi:hypothetical protein